MAAYFGGESEVFGDAVELLLAKTLGSRVAAIQSDMLLSARRAIGNDGEKEEEGSGPKGGGIAEVDAIPEVENGRMRAVCIYNLTDFEVWRRVGAAETREKKINRKRRGRTGAEVSVEATAAAAEKKKRRQMIMQRPMRTRKWYQYKGRRRA